MPKSRLLPTLQRIFRPVKQPPDAGARRAFEGSAPFVIGLGLALVSAALAAPRATEPLVLPLPEPHRATLVRKDADDRARVERARSQGLSYAVRAVGEALRRYGAAAAVKSGEAPRLLARLRGLMHDELAQKHTEELLALRAAQTELFVGATHTWEHNGREDRELDELGGDFAELAHRSGWLDGQRLALEDDERALLFRSRWNELTGVSDTPPFVATLDEQRARFSLLLRHPSGKSAEERLARQLGYVGAIEKLDHDYPGAFARGVLYYRAEAYDAAAEAFRIALAAHRDGPWTLRAKNHLLEALAHVSPAD
jgi:tetratricopeptide (TPR) repeat protein